MEYFSIREMYSFLKCEQQEIDILPKTPFRCLNIWTYAYSKSTFYKLPVPFAVAHVRCAILAEAPE